MKNHWCIHPSYPGGQIVCFCVRGRDHTQEYFDVPVGEEPKKDD